MPLYTYSPLDVGAGQIRLLALLPGEFHAPVLVAIETTYLTSQIIPPYNALSYSWGAVDDTVSIQVGEFGDDTLAIPRNLGIALPYLRHIERPRVLWIDAICIDQRNPEERGHQVERMADIFRMATQVIAWLGTGSDSSASAMRNLRMMGSHVEVDWKTLQMTPARKLECNVLFADLTVVLPYDETQLRAIWQLLNRSWFERLWVQQEIRLANGRAILKCGNKTIFWTHFRHAIFCLRTKMKAWEQPDFIKRLQSVYRMCELLHDQSIGELLRSTCHYKCSDPRDRIYGLLSLMASNGTKLEIQPDYRKTTRQVYSDLVLRVAQQLKHLEILRYCEMHDKVGTISMPSWVPDWTVEGQSDTIDWGNASGGVSCEVKRVDESILRVTGVYSAVIRYVQGMSEDIFSDEGLRWQILRWIDFIIKGGYNDTRGGRLSNSFSSTFCRSEFREIRSIKDYPSVQEAKSTFQSLFKHYLSNSWKEDFWLEPLPKHEHDKYLQRVRAAFKGRSCFRTGAGRIGLGPKAAKEGDLICIVLGCSVPLVLRPTSSGHLQIVGSAYVDYLMDGSAVLGLLPPHWQRFQRIIPGVGFSTAFQNTNDATGAYVSEDPRLGRVPSGWRRKNHDKDHLYSLFVHRETGEDSEEVGDPRLTLDAIQARGVELEIFDLV